MLVRGKAVSNFFRSAIAATVLAGPVAAAHATTDDDFTQGAKFAEEGRIDLARKFMEKVIMKKITDPPSMARRAMAYRVLTEYGRALTDATEALRLNPKLSEAIMTQGICLYFAGDYRMAFQKLDQAIRMDKKLGDAYVWRGYCYYRSDHYKSALDDFNAALNLNARRPDALCGAADTYLSMGDPVRAACKADTALAINKDFAEAFVSKAMIDVYGQTSPPVKIGKHRVVSTSMFSKVTESTGSQNLNLKRAVERCNKALKLKPKLATAYSVRAVAFDRAGDSKKSIADFSIASGFEPESAAVLNNFGIAYIHAQDFEKANKAFSKSFTLSPKNYRSLVNKATVRVLMDQPDKAIRDASFAIRINETPSFAYRNRAVALKSLGQTAEASVDFQRSRNLKNGEALFLISHP